MSCFNNLQPATRIMPNPNASQAGMMPSYVPGGKFGNNSEAEIPTIPMYQQEFMPATMPMMPAQQAGYAVPTTGVAVPAAAPSGITVIPATGATLSGAQVAPSMLNNPEYIPGFLRTQIGKKVRIEFLIGTGTTTDRIGTLVGVGSSYVLLLLEESDDIMMADLYAIKFVTIYH